MVSVLASSAIDCGYEPRSCQTKEYKIGSSIQNHDHSVEGDLVTANSAQTVLYFFLLLLYKTSTCKIFIVKECLIKSRNSHCLNRYQVTLIVLD
jgi:hypothetical protein